MVKKVEMIRFRHKGDKTLWAEKLIILTNLLSFKLPNQLTLS